MLEGTGGGVHDAVLLGVSQRLPALLDEVQRRAAKVTRRQGLQSGQDPSIEAVLARLAHPDRP